MSVDIFFFSFYVEAHLTGIPPGNFYSPHPRIRVLGGLNLIWLMGVSAMSWAKMFSPPVILPVRPVVVTYAQFGTLIRVSVRASTKNWKAARPWGSSPVLLLIYYLKNGL
jgi:hypothetical protein